MNVLEEAVRERLEKYGLGKEEIKEVAEILARLIEGVPDLIESIDNWTREFIAAVPAFLDSLAELAKMADSTAPMRKRQKIRPPRYIGPRNKTVQKAQRPPRVARSSCRKIRK